MPSVISLKTLKESSSLKDQIQALEQEKTDLLKQLELQKKFENKLREDIADQKKDFEHLEQQFDHFAGLEAEYEALQAEVQMERLEAMVSREKEEAKLKAQVKKAREELREAQEELKELKKLDPQRLKRQVGDLKKKSAAQAGENKTVNNALVSARKELREVTQEKESLDAQLTAARREGDWFWQSPDSRWKLFETRAQLQDEDAPAKDQEPPLRVRCLDSAGGVSVLSRTLDEDGQAQWHGELDIPEEVSREAGNRLKKIAAEAEEAAQEA